MNINSINSIKLFKKYNFKSLENNINV